jgi:hypothetical protein
MTTPNLQHISGVTSADIYDILAHDPTAEIDAVAVEEPQVTRVTTFRVVHLVERDNVTRVVTTSSR